MINNKDLIKEIECFEDINNHQFGKINKIRFYPRRIFKHKRYIYVKGDLIINNEKRKDLIYFINPELCIIFNKKDIRNLVKDKLIPDDILAEVTACII